MLGGAYAASNNSGGKATASAKAKKGPRGPKAPRRRLAGRPPSASYEQVADLAKANYGKRTVSP